MSEHFTVLISRFEVFALWFALRDTMYYFLFSYHPTSSNWASHLDDENDSDTDSKVSGSLAVDKAW